MVHPIPGVFFEESAPEKTPEFRTGVPAFLGFAAPTDSNLALKTGKFFHPYVLTRWRQFHESVGDSPSWGFLGQAVKGFFENGGRQCVVVGLPFDPSDRAPWQASAKTTKALECLESREDIDLVCFPDASVAGDQTIDLQRQILAHCRDIEGRFAILDSLPAVSETQPGGGPAQPEDLEAVVRHWQQLLKDAESAYSPANGALYFPWIQAKYDAQRFIPPCGHIAGIYSRVDARVGVHKAPANEVVEGAVDLQIQLRDEDQRGLSAAGVNCLRTLPGRGIRVWGARTLSGLAAWRQVNVRRLFLTVIRWMSVMFQDLVLEPYTPALWRQIRARVNGFCYSLFQQGALKGYSASEAFYVKCDEETNPLEEQEAGRVITHVGLAPVLPAEFIVVRIAQSAAGTSVLATAEMS